MVVQRTFDLIGPSMYGWWKETDITYSWDGPKLVQTNKDTFREDGQPSNIDPGLGVAADPMSQKARNSCPTPT